MPKSGARRVTIFEGPDGLWRYKAQGWNWRTLHETTIGAPRSTVNRIVKREYPDAELIVEARS